nr:hypothetical protein [Tanacetum cinerariifolium]
IAGELLALLATDQQPATVGRKGDIARLLLLHRVEAQPGQFAAVRVDGEGRYRAAGALAEVEQGPVRAELDVGRPDTRRRVVLA